MEEIIQKALVMVEKAIENKEQLDKQELIDALKVLLNVVREHLIENFRPVDYPDF